MCKYHETPEEFDARMQKQRSKEIGFLLAFFVGIPGLVFLLMFLSACSPYPHYSNRPVTYKRSNTVPPAPITHLRCTPLDDGKEECHIYDTRGEHRYDLEHGQ